MRGHSINSDDLELVYDENGVIDAAYLRDRNIIRYRTKTIKSGDILEVQSYPIWDTCSEIRKAKANLSTSGQRKLNHRNRQSAAIRLINANFTDKDMWATLTYSDKSMPPTYDAALKEGQKFIRRLKYYAQKHNYDELKYFHSIEQSKKGRWHHHLVTNFRDRDVLESLWRGGARKQTRRLQEDINGYEGLARYITKEELEEKQEAASKKRHMYICSKNLVKPKVTVSDYKISRAQARKIAEGRLDPMQLFKKLYPGYEFNTCEVKTSDYVSGCYLYVKLHKFRN